jgi:simple sugar transport system permease protein
MSLDLPAALTHIFQGMLLFFLLAADFFIFYRIRTVPREAPAHAAAPLVPSAEKQG